VRARNLPFSRLAAQSVGAVAFTGPPVYGAFFALVGICGALADRASTEVAAEGAELDTGTSIAEEAGVAAS